MDTVDVDDIEHRIVAKMDEMEGVAIQSGLLSHDPWCRLVRVIARRYCGCGASELSAVVARWHEMRDAPHA